jgi:adenylate cyclase
MASLEIMLLGGFRARMRPGDELVPRSKKAALLLARLALRAGEVHTRETLIGLLWSDRAEAQARASLRQELTLLRKMMAACPPALAIDGERLSLDPTAVEVDVRAFEQLAASESPRDLDRAATLYRGPLLEGFAVRDAACEEWLAAERQRLRDLFLGVLDRSLARQLQEGALHRAITTAQTLLAHDPLREDAHRTLMVLHAQQGRRSLALKQFQLFADLLRSELGVEPEPETVRLHEEILAGRTWASHPPATQASRSEDEGRIPASVSPKATSDPPAIAATPFAGSGPADAYQFYLMGRSFFLRNVWGKSSLEAARRLFEQAIEIDPHYARAYAGLVNCDCYRLLLGIPNASFDTIAANSARALELEADLAEAHAAKGLALYTAGQQVAANPIFEHAVRLGPDLFEAHYFYARNCRTQGLHEKAAQLFERSAAINQNDFRSLGLLVDEYRTLGRLEDSISAARRCLKRINVEVAAQPDDSYALAFGANILAELGEQHLAEEWATRASRIDPDDAIVNYNLACTYAALGRLDDALERLRATFGGVPINRRAFLEWMQQDSAIDPLRGHPDFLALVGQLEEGIAISAADRTEAPSLARAAGDRPAIAVLPFTNLSGDPEEEYFADGLTEDIITDLSRVSALFVVARNTVFTFKGRVVAIRDAARALKVRYLLEGSVRKAAGRVRITAQLVDGRTGGHLWANRYDRSLDSIFALQDEISQSIVDALKVQLLPAELATITSRPTTNAEAYQCYLMGRSFFLGGGRERRALHLGRQMFGRAIEIDPRYARAHAGLANCESYLLCLGDATASLASILASSEQALALEPDLAEAHAAKGLALYMSGCHADADIVLEKAVRLGSDLFEAHYFAGRNHQARGQYEEAAARFERAAEIEPADFLALGLAVATYRSLGREDDMRSAARRCLERVDAAIAAHPDNAGALAFGASVQAELGDKARAEAWAIRAAELDPANAITNYNLACARAALGKLDAASAHLQQVFAGPLANWRSHLEWMKHDSSIDPLRAHPDYDALLKRLEAEARPEPIARKAGIPDVGEPAPVPRARDNRIAVAVLPFENLSGDPEQQYFSDGIATAVIAELSRWRQLTVLSRNQSFRYRDRPVDVTRVGRELGVRYVVEGTIHKAGDRIRVMAQLTDAASGSHLWAEQYDRHIQELFAVQDEVVQTIVGTLVGRVQAAGAELAKGRPPASLAAYDCVLRGLALPWGDPQADAEARRLYERAVDLDPGYGLAHALLALMIYAEWGVDPNVSDAALDRAFELAKKAVDLDESESMCQAVLGWVHLMRRSFDLAEQYHRRAIEMNPSNPQHLADMGSLLVYLGRPEEGLEWLSRARRVDPYFGPSWYWYQLGFAYMTARRYDEAIQAFERATTMPYWVRAYVAACHAQAGRTAEAEAWAAEALRLRPDFSATWNASKEPLKHRCDQEHLFDSLRKAGIPANAPARGGSSDGRPSVAVLPFDNLSGDPGEQLFSDGITEDIITELSRFHRLLVVARHSSFHYRDGSGDVSRIGRELQVQYLVEGSIRKDGGRIRITAQLIETVSGSHLWAEHYDRSLDDLFDLQDEVAKMIASALAGRIEVEDLAKAKRKPPESMTAYDYWLRGKKCLDRWTPEANAEARRLFAKAIESDPEFARGYAGLAFTYEWAAYYSAWDAEGSSSHENARLYAERAVALDDTDHLPHVVLGWVHHQLGEFEQAQQQFARAAAINPNDADTMMNKAMVLALEGRPDEAIEIAQFAIRLNPRHPDWYLAFLGACFFRANRYADAAALWERAPDAVPEIRACLAAACILDGRPPDARRHMEEFLRRFALHWTGQPGVRAFVSTEFAFAEETDVDRFANALRAAGMPE